MTNERNPVTTLHIPATIDEATSSLASLDALITAKQWSRAAIVWAFTEEGKPGPKPRDRTTSREISIVEFARLGIKGLTTQDTVRAYRQSWRWAIDNADASDVQPGENVTLPDVEWPGRQDADGKRRYVEQTPKAIAQAINAGRVNEADVAAHLDSDTKREAFKRLAADPDVVGHDRTRFEAEIAMKKADAPARYERQRVVEESKNKVAAGLGYVQALLAMDHIVDVSKQIGELWTRGAPSWSDADRAEFRERWSETLHELDMRGNAFAPDLDAELADLLDGE